MKHIPFLLNLIGFSVVVLAAVFGIGDIRKEQLTVYVGTVERQLPDIAVELHSFKIEYYDDRTPKRFESDITVYTEDGAAIRGSVEVNKPLSAAGWKIYQYGYDEALGSESPYSVFLLVTDPWLPAAYAGIFIMLAGAVSVLLTRRYSSRRKKLILPCALLLAAAFVCFFTPMLRAGSLAPALQSPWFVPHVTVYMLSYALMTVATVMSLFKKADPVTVDDIVFAGYAFFTIGMLFGALWAKEAWGHYWTWDPKETWAAVTWACTLLYMHLRLLHPEKWQAARAVLLLTFVCLQVCWWGLSLLPSIQALSLHVY